MRDIKYITPEDPTQHTWILDIDVIDGEADMVFKEDMTQDQRAAVSAIMCKGTIPGALDEGVDWGSLYERETSLINIDNQVQKAIQANVAGSGSMTGSYFPLYDQSDSGLKINIVKTGGIQ